MYRERIRDSANALKGIEKKIHSEFDGEEKKAVQNEEEKRCLELQKISDELDTQITGIKLQLD